VVANIQHLHVDHYFKKIVDHSYIINCANLFFPRNKQAGPPDMERNQKRTEVRPTKRLLVAQVVPACAHRVHRPHLVGGALFGTTRRLASPLQSPSPVRAKEGAHSGTLRQQPLRGGGREPLLGTREPYPPSGPCPSVGRRSRHCPGTDLVSFSGKLRGAWGLVWIWTGRGSDHVSDMDKPICVFVLPFSRCP
jgi:hypothetical protein